MLAFSTCTWKCSPFLPAWSLQRACQMSQHDQQARHKTGFSFERHRASRHRLTAAAGHTPPAPDPAGDALLEEWLQLEADEPWDDADANDDGAEQQAGAPADTTGSSAAANSPQAADETSSNSNGSGDSREPSWSESLPYKLRRGELGWDGQVPPDVVVIAPPQRDAEGNVQMPLPGSGADKQPASATAQQQPSPTSRSQRRPPPPKPRVAMDGRPHEKAGKGSHKGRHKCGNSGGNGGGRPAGPDWLRNLPPAG